MVYKFFLLLTIASAWPLEPRIFHGNLATKGQFPWQVGLYIEKIDDWCTTTIPSTTANPCVQTTFCGGALISDRWVLTAGHCVYFALFEARRIDVLLGTTKSTGDDPDQLKLTTTEWTVSDEYNPWTYDADIALIKLPEPVSFNDYIKPIALTSEEVQVGVPLIVGGWGATSPDGVRSEDLTYTTIYRNETCTYKIIEGAFCALPYPNSTSQNICGGDSGSAVVLNSSEPVHVGIVSTYWYCDVGLPAGFASTAFARDWIKKTTGI